MNLEDLERYIEKYINIKKHNTYKDSYYVIINEDDWIELSKPHSHYIIPNSKYYDICIPIKPSKNVLKNRMMITININGKIITVNENILTQNEEIIKNIIE